MRRKGKLDMHNKCRTWKTIHMFATSLKCEMWLVCKCEGLCKGSRDARSRRRRICIRLIKGSLLLNIIFSVVWNSLPADFELGAFETQLGIVAQNWQLPVRNHQNGTLYFHVVLHTIIFLVTNWKLYFHQWSNSIRLLNCNYVPNIGQESISNYFNGRFKVMFSC